MLRGSRARGIGGIVQRAFGVVSEVRCKGEKRANECIAETLKYLYLAFTDEEVLSLDQWVLSTGGSIPSEMGGDEC